MKAFITGGAGFIGSSLADRLLAEGHLVTIYDNFNDYYDPALKERNIAPNLDNANYDVIRGDIEDEKSLLAALSAKAPDVVIHLAARAGIRPSLEHPVDYMKTNVVGTANLLNAMAKLGLRKLVFASSSSVYGNCRAESFSEKLKVTEPISPYAASKSACEQLCYTFQHLYHIKTVCLRFFTVYGPRQRPDLAIRKFIDRIDNGEPIDMYGDGSSRRDYTFIKDIISGIRAAIDYNGNEYEIINLGGGEPITLNRMIATIEKVLGKKAVINRLPMQPGDVDKTVCDWSKAKKLLKYTPSTTFEDGIRAFVEWRCK